MRDFISSLIVRIYHWPSASVQIGSLSEDVAVLAIVADLNVGGLA
jgi:hypothetical protein